VRTHESRPNMSGFLLPFWRHNMELSIKEKRLFDYYLNCIKNKLNPTVGDVCKACHTVPYTLLTKTEPSLIDKLKRGIDGIDQGDIELILEVMFSPQIDYRV
jgi:hypothetical protein